MERISEALRSRHRWAILFVVAAVMLAVAYYGMGMVGYVESFIGSVFKMAAAAYLAFAMCRYIDKVDLSAIEDPSMRAEVGKSRAMIIAAAMLGAAIGA